MRGGLVVDGELGEHVPALGGGELGSAPSEDPRVPSLTTMRLTCLAKLALVQAVSDWTRVSGASAVRRNGLGPHESGREGVSWKRNSLVGPICFPSVRVCVLYSRVTRAAAPL